LNFASDPISKQPKQHVMKTSAFVSFCLVLLSIILSTHFIFRNAFGASDKIKLQLAQIDKQRQEADFRAELIAHQLSDYQQQVATLLPDALKNKDASYPLRQLASVAIDTGETIEIERASSLLEEAKTAFREKDFDESNNLLGKLLNRYPSSVHAPEAHFLLAEGLYQEKDFAASAGTIEKMIERYPENELTGFALLRLGHIFETQDRLEDASDIYRAVLVNFKQPDILKQAKVSLRAVNQ
jgi:TolA-binding protein